MKLHASLLPCSIFTLLTSHLPCLTAASPLTSPSNSTLSPRSPGGLTSIDPKNAPYRQVWLLLSRDENKGIMLADGVPRHPMMASIAIGSTFEDNAMNIAVSKLEYDTYDWALGAQVAEQQFGYATQPYRTTFTKGANNMYYELPWFIRLRNEEILNPANGYGIASRLWGADPLILAGQNPPVPYHGPLAWVEKVLSHDGFFGSNWANAPELAEARGLLANARDYYINCHVPMDFSVDQVLVNADDRVKLFKSRVDPATGRWVDAPPDPVSDVTWAQLEREQGIGPARKAPAPLQNPADGQDVSSPLLGLKLDEE